MRKIVSLLSIWSLAFLSTEIFADTRIQDDLITVGKPGSSSNKSIKFKGTTQEVRANTSTGKLEYSNDGSLYKPIGSGSGSGGSSGVNLLVNDSFEDGISSPWTNSGGTFSQQIYAVGGESDTKYGRFIASGSGEYIEQIVSVQSNFSAGCQADFKKVNIATAGLFKVQALDVSNNVLAEQTIGVSSWIKVPTISFPCPASGTNNLKLRLISLAAGTIDFDRGYIGSNQNLVNTIASYNTNPTSYTPVFGAGFGTVAAITMKWQKLGGSVRIFGDFTLGAVTTGSPSIGLPIVNGVQLIADSTIGSQYKELGKVTVGSLTGSFTKKPVPLVAASSSSILFSVAEYALNSINPLNPQGNASLLFETGKIVSIDVTIPIDGWSEVRQQDVAVSNEQSSWYLDLNIGGTSPASTITTTYTPWESGTLDMVINSGSASATIPCSSTNASTGLTCSSGNEQLGAVFDPPHAGVFEACLYGGMNNSSGSASIATQWVETSLNSQTIIQEGKSRMNFSVVGASATNVSNCGIFTFDSISKRTLRFSYESSTTTVTLDTDRAGSAGQRDAHIVVRPLLSAYNRPILTGDQVTSPGTSAIKFASAKVSLSGVVSNEKGDFIVGNGSGTNPMILTKNNSFFTGTPNCVATTEANTRGISVITSPTTITINESNYSNVGGVDFNYTLMCHGE